MWRNFRFSNIVLCCSANIKGNRRQQLKIGKEKGWEIEMEKERVRMDGILKVNRVFITHSSFWKSQRKGWNEMWLYKYTHSYTFTRLSAYFYVHWYITHTLKHTNTYKNPIFKQTSGWFAQILFFFFHLEDCIERDRADRCVRKVCCV